MDVRPRPDECLPQPSYRFREVLVSATPRVNSLDLCEGQALGDLGGAYEVIGVKLSTHASSERLR